ncbi:MAG: prepilin-type N-terminal cleavage/methylation domain-containing protein [Gammaproteobacteria bacterium]|nr:prepilin-type N-terminal cleavage/methylation domain-containing protein [Gammaproteobacteria bacterium]MCF6231092.1 prepilin-type N-terminal cleavage/methylation domain-containing protein [Gammaproteobacteria bacterium]
MLTRLLTRNYHKNRGFSLLEVLITLVVLSTGLMAVAKFQGQLIQSSTLAKNRTIAINLAQDKMEGLRGRDFALLASGTDTIDGSNLASISEHYVRTWRVAVDGTNATVEVVVEWGDYSSASGEVSTDTSIQLVSHISAPSAIEGGRLVDP